MRANPNRARRTAELDQLDPAVDWHEIYKRLTLWELPAEARFGFQLAFYRPFAVPRMAVVLERTGHFRRDTVRRAYDTGLVIHEIIWGGVDSERGRRMVKLMNALHDRPDIHAEDMTYVLTALAVVPIRFMDRYGWRRVTAKEREATWRFCDVLGERMGIAERPASYSAAEDWLSRYEAAHLAPSPAGAGLTKAVLNTLRNRLPAPARPFAAQITSALVGDPKVCARTLITAAQSRGRIGPGHWWSGSATGTTAAPSSSATLVLARAASWVRLPHGLLPRRPRARRSAYSDSFCAVACLALSMLNCSYAVIRVPPP